MLGAGCRPWMQIPSQMQTPRMQAPVDADLPGCRSPVDADAPECRPPWMQIPPLNADLPGHVSCDACWESNPHPRQTRVKTLPCPKLRLREVIIWRLDCQEIYNHTIIAITVAILDCEFYCQSDTFCHSYSVEMQLAWLNSIASVSCLRNWSQ